jgi:hypothetical protein
VQLATAAAHATPASVLTHDDSSSAAPPQHERGEHSVHEHIRLWLMLNPGIGGIDWRESPVVGPVSRSAAGAHQKPRR